MKAKFKKAPHCPNCRQLLQGENFCPGCGQRNDVRRLTSWHFIRESLDNLFAIDGRLLHTFHNLFRHPGKVPQDYVQGKRMQYMHPVRVYFLASLFLLFIIQFEGKSERMVDISDENSADIDVQQARVDNITTEDIDGLMLNTAQSKNTLSPGKDQQSPEQLQDQSETANQGFHERVETMIDYYQVNPDRTQLQALEALRLENSFWNRFLYTQSVKLADFDDKEFSRYLYSKLYWVLFLFLPVLALLLHLLYIRNKFYYPEHLFFSFYIQSVFFIVLSIASLLVYLWDWQIPALALIIAFSAYLFLSMRRFYGQGFSKTILKFTFLNLLAIPAFLLFFGMSVVVVFILF